MIEKKIHQVWIGSDMPPHCSDWCKQFRAMNPEWEYNLWRDPIISNLYRDDPFIQFFIQTNEKPAFIADRIRVLLLRDFGGIYLDVDCKPVRPLRMLNHIWDAPEVDFVAGMRDPRRKFVALHRGISFVDNTVFASAKNGWLANRLCALYTPSSKKQTGYSQGIEVLGHADGHTTRLLNFRYFYGEIEYPETILLHDRNNLGSWAPKIPAHHAIS